MGRLTGRIGLELPPNVWAALSLSFGFGFLEGDGPNTNRTHRVQSAGLGCMGVVSVRHEPLHDRSQTVQRHLEFGDSLELDFVLRAITVGGRAVLFDQCPQSLELRSCDRDRSPRVCRRHFLHVAIRLAADQVRNVYTRKRAFASERVAVTAVCGFHLTRDRCLSTV